ncbi:MAG: glycosyltransferase family 4 protein [Thermoguttaceae bacterium]
MLVIHLTSSRFFGGPERQMLELANALSPDVQSIFVSFREGGLCQTFVDRVRRQGCEAIALHRDMPHLLAAMRELTALLALRRPQVLCCHGYKADLIGLAAARRLSIPVVSVSRGWTGETLRVRVYDALDRRVLGSMDRVVCVSEAQAEKVRRAGVAESKLTVIRNAIRVERFASRDANCRELLHAVFPERRRWVVGAAGRLSPEKGFSFLIDAASHVLREMPAAGFVVFGDGPLYEPLQRRVLAAELEAGFVLAGYRPDFDDYLPHLDVLVLPSLTEGLPNVALEALAAGVPVVATDVGGTGEVVEHGVDGYLVPPANPQALARRIAELLSNDRLRRRMGARGQRRMRAHFSFAAQAAQYRRLFAELHAEASPDGPRPIAHHLLRQLVPGLK